MKLNSDQINQLYLFTRQHFVEWYDLQTELVDHLANAIEEQWQQHPNRTFDEALQMEFKKFGVFGFEDVINQKRSALTRRYNKILLREFKKSFTSPILFIVSLLGFCFYVSYMNYDKPLIACSVFFFIIFICVLIHFFALKSKFRKEALLNNRKWLYQDVLINRILITMAVTGNLFMNLLNLLKDDIQTHVLIAGSSLAQVVIMWILFLIKYKVFNELETSEKKLNIL